VPRPLSGALRLFFLRAILRPRNLGRAQSRKLSRHSVAQRNLPAYAANKTRRHSAITQAIITFAYTAKLARQTILSQFCRAAPLTWAAAAAPAR
jgi:hypothetical protein